MLKYLKYTLLFIVVGILQILVFNNIEISTFVILNIYISFIILLPIRTEKWIMLLSGLGMGLFIDFFSGTGGLHTMSALWLAFVRDNTLLVFAGKDEVELGGTPSSYRLGSWKFFRYCLAATLLFNLFFFTMEELSFSHYFIVLGRAIASSIVSAAIIFFIQLLFFRTDRH